MSTTERLRAVATGKSDNPVAAFTNFLDRFKPQMALALPKHLTPDRMARLAVTAFSTTPKLQECEPKTIAAAVMTASILGLEIGVDGQGFLVPYGKTCTFIPGWKGLVDLVSRSGRGNVWTGAVFEGDEFDYQLGDSPFVRHRPGVEDDPAKLLYVYAIGRVKDSQWPQIEVWPIEKVWKHRDKYNKVGTKHYSFRDKEMYARKIPLLQVLKYMPKSIELARAIEVANAADAGNSATIEGDFVTINELQPQQERIDNDSGEVTKQDAQTEPSNQPVATFAEVNDALTKAETIQALEDAASLIQDVSNREHQKELNKVFVTRRAEIESAAP